MLTPGNDVNHENRIASDPRRDKGLPGNRGGDWDEVSNIPGSGAKSSMTGSAKKVLSSLLEPEEELESGEVNSEEELDSVEELESEEELRSDAESLRRGSLMTGCSKYS